MESMTPPIRARRRRGGRAPDTHRRPRGGQRSGSTLTINLERTVTLPVAVRLSPAAYGRPKGRIRVPRPLLPGNFQPERRRWRLTYSVNGVRRPPQFLALPGQVSGKSSCLPPPGPLQLPGARNPSLVQ